MNDDAWPEDGYADWIGRTDRGEETIGAGLVQRFDATLRDEPPPAEPGAPAPLGIHWCLAVPAFPAPALGPDGHPRKGLILPPIPLPRRMWAGSDVVFLDPLRIGDHVQRTSRIASVERKQGRGGALAFVTLDHTWSTPRGPAIRETQTLVYRDPPSAPATPHRPQAAVLPAGAVVRRHRADPVTLFRYSALTFNGHRIHYDHPYATNEEGYADLVVHGPLQATLLMHVAAEMRGSLRRFMFRGVAPLTANQAFDLVAQDKGEWTDLRTLDAAGSLTMTAEAR